MSLSHEPEGGATSVVAMQTYSTLQLPTAKAKADRWGAVVDTLFPGKVVKPIEAERCDNIINVAEFGAYRIAHAVSDPMRMQRRPRSMSRMASHDFQLHLQLQGTLYAEQDGRTALLEEGDLLLIDALRPYEVALGGISSTLILNVPSVKVRQHLPDPNQAVGVKVSGADGLPHAAGALMKVLSNQVLGEGAFSPELACRIGDNVLDVFATSLIAVHGVTASDSAITSARRIEIKRHIETNLSDPQLNVTGIAGAVGISPRYARLLFSSDEETISDYILRRRLEECAKRLTDVLWRGRTVTEIAFSLGFNNASHFARAFRERHGVSPTEYRHSAAA